MSTARTEVNAHARLRAAAPFLGPSEARVVAVMISRSEEVVGWSTAELAAAADTSTATVIRACQSVGFRGFQHLRLELARSASSVDAPGGAGDADPSFQSAIDAVRLAAQRIERDDLAAAADLIARSGRLVLVGNGFSGPPLQDLAMRLSTLGRPVEAPQDALAQQFAAHSLAGGDVCLALSYSGANVQTHRACVAATERGARLVVVTSYARSPIGRLADIVLDTGPVGAPHGVDPIAARVAHLAVLYAVHDRLALRRTRFDVGDMRSVVADALTDDDHD